jgi:hypothetical protein
MIKDKNKEFRESIEFAKRAIGNARKSAEEAALAAKQEWDETVASLRAYVESEAFERDLDRLASRLKIDAKEYRALESKFTGRPDRVRSKASYLFHHARGQIVRAAETGGAFALFSRRSRVVLAITLICGGIKSAEIFFECYQVFVPAARRRGLHAVQNK